MSLLCLDLPTLSDCMEDETCYWWLMSSAWLISWLHSFILVSSLCPLYTSFLFNIYVLFVCCHVHTLFCSSCSVLFILCSVPLALSCSHFVLFHLLCPVHTLFCSTYSVLFILCSVPIVVLLILCSVALAQNWCMQHKCFKCLSALFRLCSELLYAAWVFNCLIALFILCSVPIALSLFALCSVPAAENCCMQHECFNSLVGRHTQSMWCWSAASISCVCASLQQTT